MNGLQWHASRGDGAPPVTAADPPTELGSGPAPAADPAAVEPRTGLSTVDEMVRSLARAADLPPAEQVPVFQAAHRTLREALSRIDEPG